MNNDKHLLGVMFFIVHNQGQRRLLNMCCKINMCVCVWGNVSVCGCPSPKTQWFPLTNCVIDHKKCWIAQSGQETGGQLSTRDIDWVNGGLCAGLGVGVPVLTAVSWVAL